MDLVATEERGSFDFRALLRGELRLSFEDPQLEERYRGDLFRSSLPDIRLAALLAAILFAGFSGLDLLVVPERALELGLVRFGFASPLLAALFAYTFHRSFSRTWQPAIAVTGLLVGVAAIVTIGIAGPQHVDTYFVGLIIVIFYIHHFTRLRFGYAAAVCWSFVALYQVLVLLIGVPLGTIVTTNFFLVTAAVVGSISGFANEYNLRQSFLHHVKLHERDMQLESIAANLPGAVYRQVGAGEGSRRFPFVSAGMLTSFGLDPERMMADPSAFSAMVCETDRDAWIQAEARAGEVLGPFQHEMRLATGDGERWVRLIAWPHHDGVQGLVWDGIMLDISELKSKDKALRHAQKMEAVGQLTGGVAHDFNNVLTVVYSNAEMLIEKAQDEETRELAERTLTAGQRAADLTRSLLTFSRQQILEPVEVDINALIEDARHLVAKTLRENIDLDIGLAPDLPKCVADPAYLQSAIVNLAANARDAMQASGGGVLTIYTGTARLDESYAEHHSEVKPGDYVLIAVSDTGEGMSQDVLEKIFDPFFTTKEPGKGTGLGLSMVYGFVKQSGGHIKAYSEPGSGTTFKIYLPVREGISRSRPVVADAAPGARGSETILLVEDDDDVRRNAVSRLQGLGYEVIAASNADEAIQKFADAEKIDLLFTDMILTGSQGGRDLYRYLKRMDPDLRVLMTTGYSDEIVRHHGPSGTKFDIISKPYLRDDLAAKVREVLDRV